MKKLGVFLLSAVLVMSFVLVSTEGILAEEILGGNTGTVVTTGGTSIVDPLSDPIPDPVPDGGGDTGEGPVWED